MELILEFVWKQKHNLDNCICGQTSFDVVPALARIIFYKLRIGYIKDQGHIGDLRAGRRNA